VLNRAFSVVCWFMSSTAALPLTAVSWMETTNTCSGSSPMMFFYSIGNVCCAFVFGRELFRGRPIRRMVRIWTGRAVFHFLPFILMLVLGGAKGLFDAYDGFGRTVDPASYALKAYVLTWLPLAGTLSLCIALYGKAEPELGLPEARVVPQEHWRYHWVFPAAMVVIGTLVARHSTWWSDLHSLERRTANSIAQGMTYHCLMFTNTSITNLQQLSAVNGRFSLSYFEQELARYGSYAGFERSIHEKYAFVSPPLSNRMVGHLVLISSRPSPGRQQTEGRMLISWEGPGSDRYYARGFDEKTVQRIFREAERLLPMATSVSPLKVKGVPLHVRITELIGLGPQWTAEVSVVLIVGAVVCLRRVFRLAQASRKRMESHFNVL